MTSTRLPVWVVPGDVSVTDLSCLALRGVVEHRSTEECAGIVAAVAWIRHTLRGPATGRDELLITADIARCEIWAAASTRADWSTPELAAVCDTLGVSYWPPMEITPGYAWGVCATLRWLTGADEQPPLGLPIRTESGELAGEVLIYTRLLAVHQGQACDPGGLRARARQLAAESRALAELVLDTATRVRKRA
ncbi:MAG TPA: hypothetical protein VGL04_04980 [Sporichthyaceae bacterium]|jgi:hypothetical protein